MKNQPILAAAVMAVFSVFTPFASAEDAKPFVKETKPEVKTETVKPYKLDTCIVSGEKLDEMGKPFVFTHEGQEIKLCCEKCKPKFDKNPSIYLKKLDGK